MAKCEECIHGEVCSVFVHTRTLICNDKADKMCKLFKSTADVVPKSEVAREIFEEIEKYWIKSDTLPDCARLVDLDKIAELKKKYTEGKQ